jgi:Flp pilus assembly protein TadG
MKSKSLNETTNLAAWKKNPLRLESGQSLVEVALLTPMLLLLLMGIIELGRYAYLAILVGNAARAGAAYGAQNQITADDPTGTNITAAACNDFDGQNTCSLMVSKAYLCQCDNAGTVGASIDCTTGSCPIGQHEVVALQVTANGTFNSLFNYPGIKPSITVSRTATLRIE